jgi:two-component system, NtrC family, sensor histidine kinase GlrK
VVNLYPRSFLGLIVLGSTMALLPLLGAIGYASLALDDFTRSSEDAILQASQVATLGYALDEELGDMQRIVRQYEALRDPMLLDDYSAVRVDWRAGVEKFAAIPALGALVQRADAMRDKEADAFAQLGASGLGLPRLKATLAAIERDLPRLVGDASRLMEVERKAFRARARALSERLVAAVAMALAVTGVMLWWGHRMLGRLLVRLERAVVTLGEGRLDKQIRLKGPPDLQRVGLRLDWLRRRMLALETERTRVLRHVSHELKTPLATIREGASLLNDRVAGPLTPDQEKVTAIMQGNAVRLQALIGALLSMQQAQHLRDQLETADVRLDELVEQTLATYQLAMRGRQLRFKGTLAPLTVRGAGDALATLASNLISNAIKFSPDGGEVRVSLTRRDEQAMLDVIDQGPGVRPEDRARIFEPFYRGSGTKHVTGVGLGLAIALEFALAHRGTLECVDSQQGAHFRLQLPIASGSAA